MKLARVEVTNYRSLFVDNEGAFAIDLADGLNAMIGPNNCGKSNVLRAIALALDSGFPFDRERDKPAGWQWTRARVTLDLRLDLASSSQQTLQRRAHAYEMSATGGDENTYASEGLVRFSVAFQGTAEEGPRRRETLLSRAGVRPGDPELLEKALAQFRKLLRFVLIESGQSLESVLAGKFREILHTVIREHLRDAFESAQRRRSGYVEGLQQELLEPLRGRIREVVSDLFPEVKDVTLVPGVSEIDETLSNVSVNVTDALETSLAAKGTGVRGAVMVAMLRYLADQSRRSMVFAVEEPEAFLHPAAQEALRDDLEKLARRKDVTVLITTHSPFIVSRDPEARVIALTKDADGRTRISGTAMGNEPHASLLGGLFRDAALPDILDRAARVPATARGIVIVEGISDEAFLNLAARKAKRPDLVRDLLFSPAGGAARTVAQAVFMKQQTAKPILVLLDADEHGVAARKHLRERFGFSKSEVLTYADMVGDRPGGTECEDLFPTPLIEEFIRRHGEDKVLRSKVRQDGGGWRYDLNELGKEVLAEFAEAHAAPQDLQVWIETLIRARRQMNLE